MTTVPSHVALPTLRIDGVEHPLNDLAVLRRDERLPGGIPWTLDFDARAAEQCFVDMRPTSTQHVSVPIEVQLFGILRSVLRIGARRPRFCVAAIDSMEVRDKRIHLEGRCAPLVGGILADGPTPRREH